MLYPSLDKDNKTKNVIIKITFFFSLLALTGFVDEMLKKIHVALLIFCYCCCFKTSRFEKQILQSKFVECVNSDSKMVVAREETFRDLKLLQWCWWSSGLQGCDYLLVGIASYSGSFKGFSFYVSMAIALVMLHKMKDGISFVALLYVRDCCIFWVCVYENKEMVNI
jgi:hypothetical protein